MFRFLRNGMDWKPLSLESSMMSKRQQIIILLLRNIVLMNEIFACALY